MAVVQSTTMSPSFVSPILAAFCDRVVPHLPVDAAPEEWDEIVRDVFCRHADDVSLDGVTAAQAFVAVRAIEAAQDCGALPQADASVGVHVVGLLAWVIAGRGEGMRHARADAMARLDWVIGDLDRDPDLLPEPAVMALRRARWDFNVLTPRGEVVDSGRASAAPR